MTDGQKPLGVLFAEVLTAGREGATELGRRLREEFERAGVTRPTLPPEEQEIVDRYRDLRAAPAPSPIDDPEGFAAWDADRIGRALAKDRASHGEILSELRVEAEALLDGTDEGDSDRTVVTAALNVLAKVQEVVIRELGHDWRGKVRPFGALARRRGTQVGAAWVGDTASGVEPITLADAVELLAIDRAQFRREADESRTAAGQSVVQGREALQRASTAQRQVDEIRRLLDGALRPNAHAAAECDLCADDTYEDWPCEDHNGLSLEPALSADLADEVRRVIELWRQAQDETRAARRGRVSVYVDGQLVAGPPVKPQQINTTMPSRAWADTPEALRAVHSIDDKAPGGLTACGLPGQDYRTTGDSTSVTCPRCAVTLGLPASQILGHDGDRLGADVIREADDDTGAVIRLQPPHYLLPGEAGERYKVVAAGAANIGSRIVTARPGETLVAPNGVVST